MCPVQEIIITILEDRDYMEIMRGKMMFIKEMVTCN